MSPGIAAERPAPTSPQVNDSDSLNRRGGAEDLMLPLWHQEVLIMMLGGMERVPSDISNDLNSCNADAMPSDLCYTYFLFFPASTLYIYIIVIDTVMTGVIMHADGAVNGCVDTVLTGWRGHISPTVSVMVACLRMLSSFLSVMPRCPEGVMSRQ
ncbi:hypothetical protein JOQ06_009824, partial [Pogonophryne albipinna]